MRIHRLLLSALVVFGLSAGASALLVAQRNPSAGGAFLPSADYDLAGDVRFTKATLTNSQNPVTVGGTQTLTNKTLTSPVITGATVTGTFADPTITGTVAGSATYTTPTLTAPVVATITNTGTLTLPTRTGGIPVLVECGATGVGNQACSPTAAAATTKLYAGQSTLSSNAAVITFPTAFAATTSYRCVANDITTRANPVEMISTSTTTATITNTTGASDVINWICVGQ